jgi:hypothetical protein
MNDQPAMLGIQVTVGPEADAEEVAEATEQLRRELLELDLESVAAAPGPEPPQGARAIDAAALGGLIVTVTNSHLFTSIVNAVRTWLAGQPQRTIRLELDGDVLELAGLSSDEQSRLADVWLARHTDP